MVATAARELEEYFAGTRKTFNVPLASVPSTDFQRDVWAALVEIPYGEVRTYGEVALSVNRPRASRAVGNANHVNPYPILVPCHRVVASTGIGGYGGGGERVKSFLLELEGVRLLAIGLGSHDGLTLARGRRHFSRQRHLMQRRGSQIQTRMRLRKRTMARYATHSSASAPRHFQAHREHHALVDVTVVRGRDVEPGIEKKQRGADDR